MKLLPRFKRGHKIDKKERQALQEELHLDNFTTREDLEKLLDDRKTAEHVKRAKQELLEHAKRSPRFRRILLEYLAERKGDNAKK